MCITTSSSAAISCLGHLRRLTHIYPVYLHFWMENQSLFWHKALIHRIISYRLDSGSMSSRKVKRTPVVYEWKRRIYRSRINLYPRARIPLVRSTIRTIHHCPSLGCIVRALLVSVIHASSKPREDCHKYKTYRL